MNRSISKGGLGWKATVTLSLLCFTELSTVFASERLMGVEDVSKAMDTTILPQEGPKDVCDCVPMEIDSSPVVKRPKIDLRKDSVAKEVNEKMMDEKPGLTEEQVQAAFRDPIFQKPLYSDPTSKYLLDYLKTANFEKLRQLAFIQNLLAAKKEKERKGLGVVEKALNTRLEKEDKTSVKNAAQLVLLDESRASKSENMDLEKNLANIFSSIEADKKKLDVVREKINAAVNLGNNVMVMDNEGDDLLTLWVSFAENKIPKAIHSYGGYCKLRHQSIVKFVKALSQFYKMKEDKVPKVYMGIAHLYEEGVPRHSYDAEEGCGYIEEEERQKLIKESKEIEQEMKSMKKPWEHRAFLPSMDALRDQIYKNDYTAISVLTSPAAVSHLLDEDEKMIKRVGIVMASPYGYTFTGRGVVYTETFNSRRDVGAMNNLLKSGVDFLGVGGGTARTVGMRTIHDSLYGVDGQGQYAEKGLDNLEKVLSINSPHEFCRILAHTGKNLVNPKWRDWDRDFQQLFNFLETEPMYRDPEDLKRLRRPPSSVQASTSVNTNDSKRKSSSDEVISESSKQIQPVRESRPPRITQWDWDRLISLFKLWYIWSPPVVWQGPSADLHSLIAMIPSYSHGINAALRYGYEEVPPKYNAAGEMIDSRGKKTTDVPLGKFVRPDPKDESVNHFSITDMDYDLVINGLQKVINDVAGGWEPSESDESNAGLSTPAITAPRL